MEYSTRIRLLASAGLAVAVLLISAPAFAETLGQAVEAALNYHPSVEAAMAGRDAQKEEALEKRSGLFPQLDVGMTGGREFSNNSTSRGLNVTRGEGYSWLWEGSLTARQLIYDGFETTRRIDAAQARRESANLGIVDLRESLALKTALTYMDVLRARESASRLRKHGDVIEDYIGRIEKMVSEGAADKTMAEQARDIRAQLKSSLAAMEGQAKAADAAYRELTGHTPDGDMKKEAARVDMIPAAHEEAVKQAAETHPAVRAAMMTEEASKLDFEAEKAAWYPDVTGEVSHMKRDLADVIGGEIVDSKAVVRLNWSYAMGGAQQARVRKALSREAESRAQAEELKRRVMRDVEVACSEKLSTADQVAAQRERVTINEGLLKAQEAQFEAARANLLHLLQTENALFNARLALLNGEYRLMAADYSILASMGRLQEALNIIPATENAK